MPSPQLQGTLFKYGRGSANVAFKSGSGAKAAIVLGGLTDGFFCCRYVEPLARALEQEGVSVVQTLLSSSYQMYGTSSLDRDAEELAQLVRHLKSDAGVTDYGIVGHSTGCQDAVTFVRHCLKDGEIEKPRFVVLQAPVSDRESLDMSPSTWKSIDVARELISRAQGEDERDKVLMPHSTQEDGAPITARRFLSLATRGGDDDVFSSDFTDEELRSAVGHMEGVPTLLLQSGRTSTFLGRWTPRGWRSAWPAPWEGRPLPGPSRAPVTPWPNTSPRRWRSSLVSSEGRSRAMRTMRERRAL